MKKAVLTCMLFLTWSIAFTQINNAKKILIVATSADNLVSKPNDHTWGCYAPEISDFYATLYSYGFRIKDVDIVSPKGGEIPLAYKMHYPKKFNLPEEEKTALENKVKNSLMPSQVNADDYNVVYYSGGFSCLVDYPSAKSIGDITATVYQNGGIVAAVCDGIAGLLPVKLSNDKFLVSNKTVTTNGFRSQKDSLSKQLLNEGALISKEKMVTDAKLITAHGVMPITVATEILNLLGFSTEKKK